MIKTGPRWIQEHWQALTKRQRSIGRSLWAASIALVVLAFLGLAIFREWEVLLSFPWQLNWTFLAWQPLIHSLALGSMFLAWHLMMSRLAAVNDWRLNFSIFSITMVARRVPIPMWYAGGRLYLYRKQGVSMKIVLNATILEVALIVVAGVICYVLLLPLYSNLPSWPWWIPAAGIGAFVVALIVRPSLLIDLVNIALRLFKRSPLQASISRGDLLSWELAYLSTWFMDGIGLFLVVSALVVAPPSLPDVIGISSISALVGLLTLILPGGFGIKELTMGALLSPWMPVSAGIVIALVYRILLTSVEFLWALVGHWIGRSIPDAKDPI